MKLFTTLALCAGVASAASAETSGTLTGKIGETEITADLKCDVGIWSTVATLDDGDGTVDTDGDGFAMNLQGGAGSLILGMYIDGKGFESGMMGQWDGTTLVVDQPYHVLHTGERIPLDFVINC